MRMPRTSRQFVRAIVDVIVVGVSLSAAGAFFACLLSSAGRAGEVFAVGVSVTTVVCVAPVVIGIVKKLVELASRPKS